MKPFALAVCAIFAVPSTVLGGELSPQQRVLANAAYLIGAQAGRAHTALARATDREVVLKDASLAADAWSLTAVQIDACRFVAQIRQPSGAEFSTIFNFSNLSDVWTSTGEWIVFRGKDKAICSNFPKHEDWCSRDVYIAAPAYTGPKILNSMSFVKENSCPGYAASFSTPKF